MDKYLFRQPSFVTYGAGVAALAGEEAQGLGLTRVLVVTDRGVRGAGLVDGVLASLASAGHLGGDIRWRRHQSRDHYG